MLSDHMRIHAEYRADRAMRLLYLLVLNDTSGRMGGVITVIVKEVCTPEPRQIKSLG